MNKYLLKGLDSSRLIEHLYLFYGKQPKKQKVKAAIEKVCNVSQFSSLAVKNQLTNKIIH